MFDELAFTESVALEGVSPQASHVCPGNGLSLQDKQMHEGTHSSMLGWVGGGRGGEGVSE